MLTLTSLSKAAFFAGKHAKNTFVAKAGTVTVTGTANKTQANTIAGFAKAVTFNISDTAANIAAADQAARNEAVNITASDDATFAEAKIINDATNENNGGSNTYNVDDTTAALVAGISSDSTALLGAGTITAN